MDRWGQGVTQRDIVELQQLLERESRLLGDFTLSSGLESKYYFNAKPVTFDPIGAELIARVMLPILAEVDANCVGGLEIGAVPIAIEISRVAAERGSFIPTCIVRDAKKQHGTKERVASSFQFSRLAQKRIAVVDDVITTGNSVIQAIDVLKAEEGCEIAGVVALVTRPEAGGVSEMRKKFDPFPYVSVFDCDFEGNLTPMVGDLVAVH